MTYVYGGASDFRVNLYRTTSLLQLGFAWARRASVFSNLVDGFCSRWFKPRLVPPRSCVQAVCAKTDCSPCHSLVASIISYGRAVSNAACKALMIGAGAPGSIRHRVASACFLVLFPRNLARSMLDVLATLTLYVHAYIIY